MINFIPKAHPSVSLLFGKRALQRIAVGSRKTQIEIPLEFVEDIPQKVDPSVSYVGNKYNALPWKDFIDIKIDAVNLIEADAKSSLTDLDWFAKIRALYAGKQSEVQMSVAEKAVGNIGKLKYPIAK